MTATEHVISLDETGEAAEYVSRSFCECGWAAPHWSHADEMPSFDRENYLHDDEAADEATAQTLAYAQAHLASVGAPPLEIAP